MANAKSASTKRRVSMHDVAREAGVSQTAVSFVLNDNHAHKVRPETRQRILRAVEQLGYELRPIGRPASARDIPVIGLLFDMVSGDTGAAELIEGAQASAAEAGVLLETVVTAQDAKQEEQALKRWKADHALGILCAHAACSTGSNLEGFAPHKAVLLDATDRQSHLPTIVANERKAAAELTNMMIVSGAKRLAFIQGSWGTGARAARKAGFLHAMNDAGLKMDDTTFLTTEPRSSGGCSATLELLDRDQGVDGIFCASDEIAVGCYGALLRRGRVAGADISVVGFDGWTLCRHFSPPLTTAKPPFHELGRLGVESLLKGASAGLTNMQIDCRLDVGGSHTMAS